MPRWVRDAVDEYLIRLGPALKTSFLEIETSQRQTEGKKLLATLRKDEFVVALDERGTELTTRELAAWLGTRMQDGRDLAFLIGGPDGYSPDVLERADFKWSLSRLTFPHAMVRVLLVEQLYRAQSVLANHPYHRE
jgi:23S rRNA (pseudouridine1915-N3)-methyltransferase